MAGVGTAHRRFEGYLEELGWQERAGNLVKGQEGTPAPEVVVLLEMLCAVEDARSQILNQAGALNQSLYELGKAVNRESPILNSLGELQGRPASVEAAVGAFHTSQRLLQAFLKAYRAQLPHPDENKPGCAQCGDPKDVHPDAGHRFIKS